MLAVANSPRSRPPPIQKQSFGTVLFMLLFLEYPYSVGKADAYINSLEGSSFETLIWTLSIIMETRRILKHKDSEKIKIVESNKLGSYCLNGLDAGNLKESLYSP